MEFSAIHNEFFFFFLLRIFLNIHGSYEDGNTYIAISVVVQLCAQPCEGGRLPSLRLSRPYVEAALSH